MKKRVSALLFALVLIAAVLCSCKSTLPYDNDKINIVCTVFPQYDMVKSIISGSSSLTCTLLLDKPTDPHSYQPVASDVILINSAEAVIYTGGDSDSFVEEILENSENTPLRVSLMEALGENELYCASHEHDEENEHDEHGHEHASDEHIWLSPLKAVKICDIITAAVISLDEANRELYEKNAAEYRKSLVALHEEYEKTLSEKTLDTLIFADRFPFIYLTTDYSLDFVAAFTGCSAESEVSAATVIELISAVDITKTPVILITETGTDELAVTVREHSEDKNQEILVLNSIQSVRNPEEAAYINFMKENLGVLEKALLCP